MSHYDPERDLRILSAMADQLEPYLIEDELFWPISGSVRGGMPRLTVGGFLLREHRLTTLRHTLSAQQQTTLDSTLAQYQTARAKWAVHFSGKIEREWQMRTHLLDEFVRDCEQDGNQNCFENWPPQAKHRTILHHLLLVWQNRTPELPEQTRDLNRVDTGLRRCLLQDDEGAFLWGSGLEQVYPRATFWWLWVVPRENDDSLN